MSRKKRPRKTYPTSLSLTLYDKLVGPRIVPKNYEFCQIHCCSFLFCDNFATRWHSTGLSRALHAALQREYKAATLTLHTSVEAFKPVAALQCADNLPYLTYPFRIKHAVRGIPTKYITDEVKAYWRAQRGK